MKKAMWVALVAAPLAFTAAVPARAEEPEAGEPRILRVEPTVEAGRTLIRIETTSGQVNYTSFTKNRTTVVVDLHGVRAEAVPADIPVGSPEVRSVHFEYSAADAATPSVARIRIERTAPGPTPLRQEGSTLVVEARAGDAAARSGAPAAGPSRSAGGAAAAEGPARRLEGIATRSDGDRLAVAIRADGRLRHDAFVLNNPPRLVIDIHGVENHVPQSQLALAHTAVSRIRVGQFRSEPDKVARVVFDLNGAVEHVIEEQPGELRIGFGGAASLALLAPPAGEEPGAEPVREAAPGVPPALPVALAAAQVEAEAAVAGAVAEEEGTLMSLDLKDADIKDVLRYFSEISGLNIILDPGVTGTVTVRLIDVPWNKALDIILKAHGYGRALDGNVMRIASVDKLRREEEAEAALQTAKLESRPLVTITRPIAYGEVQSIANVVQQTALSKKGSIIIDQRTNMLVITEVDIPEYRQRILDLIKTLDTPTPQVEIEARIVETTKTFARAFGIQYGFSHNFDASTGSTTDLTFPATGRIRGDLIDSANSGFNVAGRGYAVNLPAPGANGAIGFHLANITDQFQLDIALSALEDDGHGRVLSAPKVTTQSNISASIVSGASIPVQTVANNTITVQYLAVNLQLNVTPQVTPENTVILKVVVDNSQPDFGVRVGFSGLPPINQRRAQTTVMVPDGGTAVIGGVFQLSESNTQNRIPGVFKLPLIGWLFRNSNVRQQNNELLIFITPKIKRLAAGTAGSVPLTLPAAAAN